MPDSSPATPHPPLQSTTLSRMAPRARHDHSHDVNSLIQVKHEHVCLISHCLLLSPFTEATAASSPDGLVLHRVLYVRQRRYFQTLVRSAMKLYLVTLLLSYFPQPDSDTLSLARVATP
ncbi:hypothetical protein BU14_0191s0017 [Porphyra umbilicalis]|uniref:Uncharacterized protein n=1 Tax=Porphyra umbilicalis TaxID=2786 RepID=A0A1X6P6G6_PORUM|nr:hypothetical protein BU14_0191s0017 [Porphyra umbilicalis]|eukprot:OSX76437.1 hypothetical protein BU14_0191s0017 [Porphyra umbilicalis]